MSLPWIPLADPDTWGYLNPALQDLAGNGLVQTCSRDLAYPLFLRAVLGITGDFASIAAVQHLLGLFSGAVWLLAFQLWLGWVPLSPAGRNAAWWIAAVCLGLYLCNAATLAFESQLRPEAIFPLFGLGQVAAVLAMARARWRGGSLRAVCLAAAAAALLAGICVSLKPSWGFAVAVPFAATVLAAFANPPLSATARIAIFSSGALALVFWTAVLPPLVRWIPESAGGSFLAGTLFTVHADIVARDMHRRAVAGKLDAAEIQFLRKLDDQLAESRALQNQSYPTLGHDADYLFYRCDLLASLPGVPDNGDKRACARYLRTVYLRAALAEPSAVVRKIFKQLVMAYGNASKTLFSPSVQWRVLFEDTNKALDQAPLPAMSKDSTLDIRGYLDEVRARTAEQPAKLTVYPAPSRWVLGGPVSWILATIVIAGGVLIVSSPWWGHGLTALLPAVRAFAVVWASSFGSAFTVALVHSFDIDRYRKLLSSGATLLVACGLVLLAVFLKSLRSSDRG